MRRSVGTAMLWGAFGVTLFGIFLTPVFFYVIRRFAGPARKPADVVANEPPQTRGVATSVLSASANAERAT
jgi:hypothetical protein